MEKQMIDCTPTWEAVMPLYIDALKSGNATRIQIAEEELTRLARLVDAYNAEASKEPEPVIVRGG